MNQSVFLLEFNNNGLILGLLLLAYSGGISGVIRPFWRSLETACISQTTIRDRLLILTAVLPESLLVVLLAWKGESNLALGIVMGCYLSSLCVQASVGRVFRARSIEQNTFRKIWTFQVLTFALLLAMAFPWTDSERALTIGSFVPRWTGWIFVGLGLVFLHTLRLPAFQQGPKESLKSHTFILPLLALPIFVILAGYIVVRGIHFYEINTLLPHIFGLTVIAFFLQLPKMKFCPNLISLKQSDRKLVFVLAQAQLQISCALGLVILLSPGGLMIDREFFQVIFPTTAIVVLMLKYCYSQEKASLSFFYPISALFIFAVLWSKLL